MAVSHPITSKGLGSVMSGFFLYLPSRGHRYVRAARRMVRMDSIAHRCSGIRPLAEFTLPAAMW